MSDEKKEKIEDIVAEMRMGDTCDLPFAYRIGRPDRCDEYIGENGEKQEMRHAIIESVTVDELADRIESALEREREACGNAAAMREALMSLYDQICYGETERNVAANRQMIMAALSDPPRNCDRFNTEKEARKAFYQIYFGPTESEYVNAAFATWLLAPAKEGVDRNVL